MKKVFVYFEVSVSQSKEHLLKIATPDYVFSGEFDKDDEKSFSQLCDLEFKVIKFGCDLKDLGCQVAVIRKEMFHLDI